MSRRPPEWIIAGGQLDGATGALAETLAAGEPGRAEPGVLVWDERDVDDRWTGRDATLVVRTQWTRTWPAEHGRPRLGARAGDAELRLHLWRHRRADLALVGHVALLAAPWLRSHRGRRLWLPTSDDLTALDDGVAIPSPADGGPHRVVTHDARLRRHPRLRDDPRLWWAPGLLWAPPKPEVQPPVVLAIGAPDHTHGIDLVGWTLARRADDLRALGAHVHWIAPTGSHLAEADADDLIRAGVRDLVVIDHHPDPVAAARAVLAGASRTALVLCGRTGAERPDDLLVEAYAHGVETVAFDGPPPDLALDDRWTPSAYGDVTATADALVRSLQLTPGNRLPGPVGLARLFAESGARD